MASRFRALLAIALSTTLISGGAITTYTLTSHWRAQRPSNPHYTIVNLEQPDSSLPTDYLAELLNFSTDRPTNLYALDFNSARQKLLASPLIKSATLHRHPPDTLTLKLEVREPIATLPEYSNMAMDLEGAILPLLPFYLDEGLPKFVLGPTPSSECTYHALNLLHLCPQASLIDTSRLNRSSAGTREIILTLGGHILRLSPTHYPEALANYATLESHLLSDAIVDLRIQKLAFIGGS